MTPDEEWHLQEAMTAAVRAGRPAPVDAVERSYVRIAEAAATPLATGLPAGFADEVAALAASERDVEAATRRETRRLWRWGAGFVAVLAAAAIALNLVPLSTADLRLDPWVALALGALLVGEAGSQLARRLHGRHVDRM